MIAYRILDSLTRREREVFAGVVAGLSSKGIAEKFGTTHRTIEFQRQSILNKTGYPSMTALLGALLTGEVE